MEFMRIDPAPLVLGFRLPQLVSLVVIIFSLALIFKFYIKNRKR